MWCVAVLEVGAFGAGVFVGVGMFATGVGAGVGAGTAVGVLDPVDGGVVPSLLPWAPEFTEAVVLLAAGKSKETGWDLAALHPHATRTSSATKKRAHEVSSSTIKVI
jgi:hypothetical protein